LFLIVRRNLLSRTAISIPLRACTLDKVTATLSKRVIHDPQSSEVSQDYVTDQSPLTSYFVQPAK
jgi:hypothetical protein